MNRKDTQGWLRGHWGVAGFMNCRVSGLVKKCSRVGFLCKWLSFERLLYSKNSFLISATILTSSSDIRNYMSEWFCDAYSSPDNMSSQTKFYSDYNRGLILKQNKGTGALLSKPLTLLIWTLYILACSLDNNNGKRRKKINQYVWNNIAQSYLE